VTIVPDVASVVMDPLASNPDGVSMGRFDIRSGNPDVAIPVPAVVALMPGPVGMFVRGWRHALDDVGRGTDANDDLSMGERSHSQKESRCCYE
jgi:hypothetical protein